MGKSKCHIKIMDADWWKNAVIYHIYICSFKDGNDDGIGDFKGLTSKLDYFVHLGINTLLLSPIHPSPMKDNGYDISDFLEINPTYGNMKDFDNFMTESKKRGLNVIVDLVVNHTSDQHPWFIKSVKRNDPYTNYYVWVDAVMKDGEPSPPNNWLSVFDNSAWEYNSVRKQYYLHQFLIEQPDLNWRNHHVKKEVENIIKFWLDKKVDGFRVDAIAHCIEDELLRDEPVVAKPKCKPQEYEYLEHIHTKGLKQNVNLVREWRRVLDEYEAKTGKKKILLTESYEPIEDLMLYYGELGECVSDIPFNTELLNFDRTSSGYHLFKLISSWLDVLPKGKCANWIMGNHDQRLRFSSRIGSDLLSAMHMVTALLPGILFCYYGDEIGMVERFVSQEDTKDCYALRTSLEKSRDPVRTPMQWDNSENAGFTKNSKPYLPVHENFSILNAQSQDLEQLSTFHIYKDLLALRSEDSIKDGDIEFPFIDGNIFTMIRSKPMTVSYIVIINMGKSFSIVDLTNTSEHLPETGVIVITNNKYYYDKSCSPDEYVTGGFSPQYIKAYVSCNSSSKSSLSFKNINLLPKEGMVVSFEPKSKAGSETSTSSNKKKKINKNY